MVVIRMSENIFCTNYTVMLYYNDNILSQLFYLLNPKSNTVFFITHSPTIIAYMYTVQSSLPPILLINHVDSMYTISYLNSNKRYIFFLIHYSHTIFIILWLSMSKTCFCKNICLNLIVISTEKKLLLLLSYFFAIPYKLKVFPRQ